MIKTISLWDLMSVPKVKETIASGDEETFWEQMYYLGFDINKEIKEIECYHRTLTHGPKVMYGKMFSGSERVDSAWLSGRACTLENRIEFISETDPDLSEHLEEMCEMPDLTAMTIRSLRGEADVFSEEMIKSY